MNARLHFPLRKRTHTSRDAGGPRRSEGQDACHLGALAAVWLLSGLAHPAHAAPVSAASPVMPLPAAAAPGASTATPAAVVLFVGQVKVIDRAHRNVVRVAVGNGSLLKATVVDERQIVLLGEGAGETTVHLWLQDGSESAFHVRVHPEHTARVRAELQAMLPELPGLQLRLVGQRLLLEGRYPDAAAAARVRTLLAKYPEVLNLVPNDTPTAAPIRVDPMIHLDLRVVEVRKRALDQLGIKWASTADGPAFAAAALGYANAPWPAQAPPGFPSVDRSRPVVGYLGLASQITSALQFLEQSGDSWTLAEPRLSCKSGGKSKFVAGGEIPIPVSTGQGQTSVIYKQYGVVIEFNPVADAEGNIESSIDVEVSEPDPRNSNQGFVAFTTNRTTTQVAMRHNAPLVISGLLRQQGVQSLDGVPGLSRVPVLGALFRSREFRHEESELLVVVTPRLITPDAALNTEALARSQSQVDRLRNSLQQRLAD